MSQKRVLAAKAAATADRPNLPSARWAEFRTFVRGLRRSEQAQTNLSDICNLLQEAMRRHVPEQNEIIPGCRCCKPSRGTGNVTALDYCD
jgi:hypothetical protein